jgi:hypothetical protein
VYPTSLTFAEHLTPFQMPVQAVPLLYGTVRPRRAPVFLFCAHYAVGIIALCHDDAEVAIVGSVGTHFTPSPFAWASASGVASESGRSSAFSPKADGYSPSVRLDLLYDCIILK